MADDCMDAGGRATQEQLPKGWWVRWPLRFKAPRFNLASVALCMLVGGCATQSVRDPGAHLPAASSEPARVYLARCGACHAAPHPARHGTGDWQRLVPLMEGHMRERGMAPLTDAERDTILAYLAAHGR